MGLTSSSTGSKVISEFIYNISNNCDYIVAIAGNPNVGKSTIFNYFTGMHQHTGNWPGKTVSNASGIRNYDDKQFLFVDIPGTYSLMSNSEEEEIARNYICFGNPNATVVILDATCLERNLNLVFQIFEITKNVIVCVNLLDEAEKKGIYIDLKLLSRYLGVPVIGTNARNESTLDNLMETISNVCTKKIIPKPRMVQYLPCIEDSIQLISSAITNKTNINTYIQRWISLKLLEGESTILKSIEDNFNINLVSDAQLQQKLIEAKCLMEKNDINSENFKDKIVSSIIRTSEEISVNCSHYRNNSYNKRDKKIDKILTSKRYGIPIMLLFLGLIFWITIIGANYPSSLLSQMFGYFQDKLIYFADVINLPNWLSDMLILGIYQTVTWIISVMLPPMAIFFPLFTILEDLGYLPRIAFNLDNCFRKCCTSGKQALTMCMGFGCNAAGVCGCRIIDSPRERIIAAITNSFVPCNGRFPFLIAIATIFVAGLSGGFAGSIISTFTVLLVILLGIFLTFVISRLLSKTILKGKPSSFVLELPPYRKPQIGKVLIHSIFDRTLFVLGRAICVAVPAGLIIWLFANININNLTLLELIANFLDPFAKLMGLDGYILTAFILGIPANEIVLPIILMGYMRHTSLINIEDFSSIATILKNNGWTILTAINTMIFTLLHFPCSTTLISIKKETGSYKWSFIAFLLPTLCGITLCMITNGIYHIFI